MKTSTLSLLEENKELFGSKEYSATVYNDVVELIGSEEAFVILPNVQTVINNLDENKTLGVRTDKWVIIDAKSNGLRILEECGLFPYSYDGKYTYSHALELEVGLAADRALEDKEFEKRLEMYLRKKLDIRVNHKYSECSGSELEISVWFGQTELCSTTENID